MILISDKCQRLQFLIHQKSENPLFYNMIDVLVIRILFIPIKKYRNSYHNLIC